MASLAGQAFMEVFHLHGKVALLFGGFHSCKAGTTVVGTMDVDEEESSGDSPRTGGFVKSWNSKKTTRTSF